MSKYAGSKMHLAVEIEDVKLRRSLGREDAKIYLTTRRYFKIYGYTGRVEVKK